MNKMFAKVRQDVEPMKFDYVKGGSKSDGVTPNDMYLYVTSQGAKITGPSATWFNVTFNNILEGYDTASLVSYDIQSFGHSNGYSPFILIDVAEFGKTTMVQNDINGSDIGLQSTTFTVPVTDYAIFAANGSLTFREAYKNQAVRSIKGISCQTLTVKTYDSSGTPISGAGALGPMIVTALFRLGKS